MGEKKRSLKDLFFRFFDEHESPLEKKGKYIDWDYFLEYGNNELKIISRKTFIDYRSKWFRDRKKISFSEHIKIHDLKPYLYQKKEKYYSHSPQPVDLNRLIQNLIKKEEQWLKNYDLKEISNKEFNGTLTHNDLIKIHNNRRLYKWYGFIYILFQILDINRAPIEYRIENNQFVTNGCFVVGFSTRFWKTRWYHYKKDALEYGKTQGIHKLIRDLYNARVNLDDAFRMKILEFCWTDFKLRKREDFWINELNAKNPSIGGLNTISGGSGGSRVNIPRTLLIRYIARGLWQEEIRRELLNKYPKNEITPDILHQRIKDYWGSMSEARKKFLEPILKYLITLGYSETYIANEVFNRDRHTINSWCNEFWKKSFIEKRNELLKSYLTKLIIQGLEYREIDEKVEGMPLSTINDYIKRWWGGLKPAREELMKPIIAKALACFYNLSEISKILGHNDKELVRKYIHIFWNFPNSIKGD